MNFPDEPVFRFIYWLLNTAGLGGIAVLVIIGGLGTTFALTLLWIVRGAGVDEEDTYSYPTPTLLGHHDTEHS